MSTLLCRHNLFEQFLRRVRHGHVQVYLHLVDPNRDRAFMNKGDSVLVKECGLPGSWYDPVLHKGMTYDEKNKCWSG